MVTQTTFQARQYAGEEDLQPIVDLLNLCNDHDKLDNIYMTLEELKRELDEPDFNKMLDIQLWEDEEGRLVGYSKVGKSIEGDGDVVDGSLLMRVHPKIRSQGLETEIIEWSSERLREVGRERDKRVQVRTGLALSTPEFIAYRQAVLEEHGFTPIRYWFKMARPLNEPIPEPHFPEGFTMRHSQGEADMQPWIDMLNQSFIDHWNHHDLTIEEWKHWRGSPNYKTERDLIAIAPDGTFAALCLCWIDPEDNEHNNRKEGWIDTLGTRRGFRKIGLGTAMLLAGLHRLKADGMDTALLDVDAENPTGALRLYESVGFKPIRRSVTYHKDL